MYEQTFTRIETALRNDEGMSTELDYVEQISWVLFLKYLHNFEREREDGAQLTGTVYEPVIKGAFRWDKWAYPLNKKGKKDYGRALTGPDLIEFVNDELFPYLRKMREAAGGEVIPQETKNQTSIIEKSNNRKTPISEYSSRGVRPVP